MADTTRLPPCDLDAERSVLGGVITDPKQWSIVASLLTDETFQRDAHRRIFRAIAASMATHGTTDTLLLLAALKQQGELDDVGGPAYVSSLTDGVPRSTNVKHYASIVIEKARLREIIYASEKMITDAYDAHEPASTIVDHYAQALASASASAADAPVKIGVAAVEFVQSLDGGDQARISTGLRDLDDALGNGLTPGTVTLVASRPGVGKTTLLLNIADNCAARKIPSAIISLEMDRFGLATQLLSKLSGVDSQRIVLKHAADHEWTRVSYALETLHDRPLYVLDAMLTMAQIEAWCRRLSDEHGVKMFGLDYVQKIGDERSQDRRHREMSAISSALVRIAKELKASFVVASQINRAPEGRSDKRPLLSDLAESDALGRDAHAVLLLFRQDMYDHDPNSADAGIAEVIVAKNRSGATRVVRTVFMKEIARFADLAVG